MDKNRIYIANDEMEFTDVDGKTVIFEPTGSKVYVLNDEEKEIFSLFDGVNSVEDVERILKGQYSSEDIAADLAEYVQSLIDRDVLLPMAERGN